MKCKNVDYGADSSWLFNEKKVKYIKVLITVESDKEHHIFPLVQYATN